MNATIKTTENKGPVPAQKPPPPPQARTLRDYFRLVLLHKWGIVSLAILSGFIGAVVAWSTPPVYRADVRLLVEPVRSQIHSTSSSSLNAANMLWFYQTQREIIRSRAVAESVVRRLDLVNNPEFQPQKSKIRIALENIPALSQTVHRILGPYDEVDRNTDAVIADFRGRLKVSSVSGSEVILVQFEAGDPILAAEIANAVAKAYADTTAATRQTMAEQTVDWLAEKVEQVRQQLVQSEAQLSAYQKKAEIVDSDDKRKIESEKLSSLASELIKATTRRADAEIRKHQTRIAAMRGDYFTIEDIINNPVIQHLKADEAQANRVVAELSERYGDKHPKMSNAKRTLEAVQSRLNDEVRNIINAIYKEYDLAVAAEKKVQGIYDQVQAEIRSAKSKEFDLAKLEVEVETNRELYDLLLTRLKETDISKKEGAVNVRVIDDAKAPAAPYKPRIARMIALSIGLGALFGLGLVFLRESLNETFRTGRDIRDGLNVQLLGVFPYIKQKERGDTGPEEIVAERPKSSIAEAMNNIRTNLLFATVDKRAQVLLMTSAVADEGKTTISYNLACSLAKLGRTLIIEADMRKPRLRSLRKARPKAGIYEYVLGKATSKEALYRDPKMRRLFTLAVRGTPSNPVEFLSTKRFRESIEKLRPYFRYIVIDAPPVLAVSDAVVLSRIADATVMVVAAESTTQAVAKEAVERLNKAGATVVGGVLSKARTKTLAAYEGRYYYAYGQYYQPAGAKG